MSDKTEAPSPRKLSDAREKGNIARSVEIGIAVGLLAAFGVLRGATGNIVDALVALMRSTFTHLPVGDLSAQAVADLALGAGWKIALAFAPFALTLAAAGVAANLAQTGGLVSTGLLSPDLQRLNPLAGFQRLVSRRGLIEVAKSALKLLIVGWAVYSGLRNEMLALLSLASMSLRDALGLFAAMIFRLGLRAAGAYALLAAADYFYQRRRWLNELRMTKQEAIEEIKRSEGDPQLRQRIRQQGRRLARQRMMSKVPQATVVLTNPTHLAVALRYDRVSMSAPRVVAKGARLLAERIVKIARANGVPVMQNIPLARALYSGVQVDQEIPPALYQAVAEVLAFVFGLKKSRRVGQEN